jgi:hypothetical protein
MAGMRAWCATLALVALATLPVGRGFAPAAAPAARALRGGNGRRPGGRACASGAASLRAILDKIPLPQSPRPSEIMKSLENKEVRRGVCVCVCVCVCVLVPSRHAPRPAGSLLAACVLAAAGVLFCIAPSCLPRALRDVPEAPAHRSKAVSTASSSPPRRA